jgi:transglutaminase-like putative cysteine protease
MNETGVVHRVRHLTRYSYPAPATLCHNVAHLTPRPTPAQSVRAARLNIDPVPDERSVREDAFGNAVTYFSVVERHESLTVVAESEVEVRPPPPPGGAATANPWEASVVADSWAHPVSAPTGFLTPAVLPGGPAQDGAATGSAGDRALWVEYALPSPLVPPLEALAEFARPSFAAGRPGVEAVLDLMERIHQETSFDPHVTSVATPLSEVIEHRRGVCQDFAHLALGCVRSMGLAARYVSGYLETLPPPGKEKLVGADASHAWCSVWLAGHGWLDMDPTNGQVPTERHITVAWGRDYGDVTPLKGVVFGGGGAQELTVEVDVGRI